MTTKRSIQFLFVSGDGAISKLYQEIQTELSGDENESFSDSFISQPFQNLVYGHRVIEKVCGYVIRITSDNFNSRFFLQQEEEAKTKLCY